MFKLIVYGTGSRNPETNEMLIDQSNITCNNELWRKALLQEAAKVLEEDYPVEGDVMKEGEPDGPDLITELKEKVSRIESDLVASNDTVNKYEDIANDRDKKIDALTNTLAEANNNLDLSKAELSKVMEENKNLQAELDKMKAESTAQKAAAKPAKSAKTPKSGK